MILRIMGREQENKIAKLYRIFREQDIHNQEMIFILSERNRSMVLRDFRLSYCSHSMHDSWIKIHIGSSTLVGVSTCVIRASFDVKLFELEVATRSIAYALSY